MALSWTIFLLGCLSFGLAPLECSATESPTTTAPKKAHEAPAADLGALLDAAEGAVVTLVAGDTRLAAHRAVLAARSPTFKAMLSGNSLEASIQEVVFIDVEGPVLRELLVYLYTLQAPRMSSMAPQLLAAADSYGVSGLKSACEQQLVARLSAENAASSAVLALRHSCPRLQEAAVAFIRANLLAVMSTEAWHQALASHPNDVIHVMQLLAQPPPATSTPAATDGGSGPEPQPHTANRQTTAASTPATAAISTSLPGGGAVSSYSTPAAANSGSAPGQTHSGSSQTPAASTPAPPACNASPPDDDKVSEYRNLSASEKGRMLIKAAKIGDAEEAQALLAAGADVGAKDEVNEDRYWATALHWAVREGEVDVASCLLAGGAEVDAKDKWGRRPLHLAAHKGRPALVQLLAAASADVNARDDSGMTPLHFAAEDGEPEAAAALLEAGADRGIRDNWDRTPLDIARTQELKELLTES